MAVVSIELAGRAGQALVAVGALLAAAGALATLPGLLRVRRRALAMGRTAASSRTAIVASIGELSARWRRTAELGADLRRRLRWLRHPLVPATLRWYLRRRRAAR